MAHSEQEILAGLAEIVSEETGLPTDSVLPEKSFTDDLDIDSLSMMTIVTLAEEKFEVRIPDDEVKNLATVGDAVSFISNAPVASRHPPGHPEPPARTRHPRSTS
jgi:acyl carrier protein